MVISDQISCLPPALHSPLRKEGMRVRGVTKDFLGLEKCRKWRRRGCTGKCEHCTLESNCRLERFRAEVLFLSVSLTDSRHWNAPCT